MQRRPEQELMDDLANAAAYAAADFAEPHNRFVELFRERFATLSPDARVLDLGCGPADVTLRFAKAFPDCRIDALDGSEAMLQFADKAVTAAGEASRIKLIQHHLPDTNLPTGYDVIISNSLLHHLHEPEVLWETIKQAGNAGSAVFVMDLMRPASDAEARRMVEDYAANESEILRQDFYNSLHAAYRLDEIRGQLQDAGLGYLHCEAVSDRHLIVWGTIEMAWPQASTP